MDLAFFADFLSAASDLIGAIDFFTGSADALSEGTEAAASL